MAMKKRSVKNVDGKRRNPREALERYRQKRDFHKTPEPSGSEPVSKPKKAAKKLFFCVQKHLASHLHYDFRLEWKGVLLSWAVPKGPSLRTSDKRLAMRVEDHPWGYKDFEGVIPEGYGAGVVMLWDQGAWSPEPGFENVSTALAKGELKFRLDGGKLKGGWVLVRTSPKTQTGEREQWLLIKHRDEWAGDVDVAAAFPRSIKTDRSFEEIVKSDPDVWQSHKSGDADLTKIVEKVMKLAEEEGKGTGSQKPTAKREARGK